MALKMQDGSETDERTEETEEIEVAKKKPPIKLILLAVILIVLIGCGAKAAIYYMHHKPKHAPVILKVGESVPLDEFMMNLADPGGDHYIKMTLALGLKQGVAAEAFKDKVPECRDAIVMVLSNKKLSDMDTIPGKLALKQEIKDACNTALGEKDVLDVYYQAFATQ